MFLRLCEIYKVKDINKEFESIKEKPLAQKAEVSKEELVKLLSYYLIRAAYIESGGDLTDEQLKITIAIINFIDVMFR